MPVGKRKWKDNVNVSIIIFVGEIVVRFISTIENQCQFIFTLLKHLERTEISTENTTLSIGVPCVVRSFEECHWRFVVVNRIRALLEPYQRLHQPLAPTLPIQNKRNLYTVFCLSGEYLIVCHGLDLSVDERRRNDTGKQANLQIRASIPNSDQLNLVSNGSWWILFGVQMNKIH